MNMKHAMMVEYRYIYEHALLLIG